MGNLADLKLSIQSQGLITPIAVQKMENGKFKLLAGGRRFTCLLELPEYQLIPCRVYDTDTSGLRAKEIELDENVSRKDFEYWERDNLIRDIHTTKQQIYGKKAPGPTRENAPGWGTLDTAKAVGLTGKGDVSMAIKRAEMRDKHPELFQGAVTAQEATKRIKKLGEQAAVANMTEKVKALPSDSILKRLTESYIIGDALTELTKLPAGVFHFAEVDPPYGIGLGSDADKRIDGDAQKYHSEYTEISDADYGTFLLTLCKELFRVTHQHSWTILWHVYSRQQMCRTALEAAGFSVSLEPALWIKTTAQNHQPNSRLTNVYEPFLVAWKGAPTLNIPGANNCFICQGVPSPHRIHPAERPLVLMQNIFRTFCTAGQRALIPFLGSGKSLLAAQSAGISALGFDLSEEYKKSYLSIMDRFYKGENTY